ncbi:hypothetical protein SeMB42_g07338 [Synchytrium endobioticum]|uniref:NADH:ubiquinone oxidoreductase intermediate-associated protein 30 domain-containing protein n=1 Tax=Synchytrium endobioticum TaxID=286115 RepID=A0A507C8X3_9FUNG|nr:hypothetical protein SeMB42_g07338 [Synchytrium endobioticum]TPX40686.1 hypothetical protein SeLEV6574_g06478 [Synchytrium endobioticum]
MANRGRARQGLQIINSYLQRSWKYAAQEVKAGFKFDPEWKKDMTLFQFGTVEDLDCFIIGSDADIGGLSEAYWGLTPHNTGLFWGKLSTEIPPSSNMKRSGYAGIRSRERPVTLLHRPTFDISLFRYLTIRARGDSRLWFVNIQTETPFQGYLWQHRLQFLNPGEWETLMIPLRDFVLTSNGIVQPNQLTMNREKVKNIGFSIVRQAGEFALELDWIKVMNTPRTFGDLDLVRPGEVLDDEGNIIPIPKKKRKSGCGEDALKSSEAKLWQRAQNAEKIETWKSESKESTMPVKGSFSPVEAKNTKDASEEATGDIAHKHHQPDSTSSLQTSSKSE